jgi:serine/threonine protein kinase
MPAAPLDGFVWCPHCGSPHGLVSKFCPRTGKALTSAAARAASPPEQIHAGTVIGKKYYVVGLIGQGGQSIVYEAMHTALGQRVALKFLAKESNKKAQQRFEQEARLAATIVHPNVCRSYDIGTLASGTRYIVMERLQGETLAAMIGRQGALEPLLAVDLASQVLSALSAFHQAMVAHRDIKPGNVFVEQLQGMKPTAKVLDFGLAKDFSGRTSIRTTLGRRLGTPAYMSPEQLLGNTIDGRTDVFAVGVLLYEALSGKRPFDGESHLELYANIIREVPRPLPEVRPGIPEMLDVVVQRALAKDPAARFATADEMRRTLALVKRAANLERKSSRRVKLGGRS